MGPWRPLFPLVLRRVASLPCNSRPHPPPLHQFTRSPPRPVGFVSASGPLLRVAERPRPRVPSNRRPTPHPSDLLHHGRTLRRRSLVSCLRSIPLPYVRAWAVPLHRSPISCSVMLLLILVGCYRYVGGFLTRAVPVCARVPVCACRPSVDPTVKVDEKVGYQFKSFDECEYRK